MEEKETWLIKSDITLNQSYVDALKKVIEVRSSRRKMYGDTYINSKDRFFVTMIEEKANRMAHIFDNGVNSYEKTEDTLIDIANYAIMYLDNLQQRKNGK